MVPFVACGSKLPITLVDLLRCAMLLMVLYNQSHRLIIWFPMLQMGWSQDVGAAGPLWLQAAQVRCRGWELVKTGNQYLPRQSSPAGSKPSSVQLTTTRQNTPNLQCSSVWLPISSGQLGFNTFHKIVPTLLVQVYYTLTLKALKRAIYGPPSSYLQFFLIIISKTENFRDVNSYFIF